MEPQHQRQQAELQRLNGELQRITGELRDEITNQIDRAVDRVIEFEVRSRKDIIFAGDQVAAAESNRFATEYLAGAKQFGRPRETLGYGSPWPPPAAWPSNSA